MKNRIKELRTLQGVSLAQLEERTGISAQQINRLEKGERRLNEDNLYKLASALSRRPHELLEEGPRMIRVSAYVGEDGEVHPYNDSEKTPEDPDVASPPGLDPTGVVAIRIKSESMMPVLQPEWVVFYSDRRDTIMPLLQGGWQVPYNQPTEEPLSEFFDKMCIIKLRDGRTMLRTLNRGYANGKYILSAFNRTALVDVEIEWAAKIVYIKTA